MALAVLQDIQQDPESYIQVMPELEQFVTAIAQSQDPEAIASLVNENQEAFMACAKIMQSKAGVPMQRKGGYLHYLKNGGAPFCKKCQEGAQLPILQGLDNPYGKVLVNVNGVPYKNQSTFPYHVPYNTWFGVVRNSDPAAAMSNLVNNEAMTGLKKKDPGLQVTPFVVSEQHDNTMVWPQVNNPAVVQKILKGFKR